MKLKYTLVLPALIGLVAACQDNETEPAAPSLPVSAAFTMPAKAPLATAVSFQNQSQNATQYTWSFGDGSKSQDKSPTHTYTNAGQYAVRLLASAGLTNDSASIRQIITIEDTTTIKAAFTAPTEGVRGVALSFQNQSRGATTYAWLFGDGTASQQTTPMHAYAAAGTYQVKLRAYKGAKVDSVMRAITIR